MELDEAVSVIVTGGRDYADRDYVFATMDAVKKKYPNLTLYHGGCTGADTLAHEWALSREVMIIVMPAEWKKYGRSAGPKRNETMLWKSLAKQVIAFPGGRGTENMVGAAEAVGVKVWRR